MTGVIHWPQVCGTVNDVFWDYNVTVNTTRPDLPECFQQTVLVWVPAALLWVCLPVYALQLSLTPTLYSFRYETPLNTFKILLSLLLVLLSVVELVYYAGYQDEYVPPYLYIKPSVNIASFLLIALLQHVEFSKDIHSSGVSFIFWTLELLCSVPIVASKIIHAQQDHGVEDVFEFTVFFVFFALVLVEFLLCFRADYRREGRTMDALRTNGVSERTPLLAASRESSQTLLPSEINQNKRVPCPEARAVFPSVVTYWWITSLLVKGYKRFLTFDDLPDILESDKASAVFPLFESGWASQGGNKPPPNREGEVEVVPGRPSLYRTMLRVVWKELLLSALLRVVVLLWEFSQPLLLQALIAFVDTQDPRDWYGYTISGAMFLASMLYGTTFHASFKYGQKCGMRLRSALTIAVYRKALRMSNAARQTTTVGEIVNLMSVDTQKIQDACNELQELWACPVTIGIALYLLWGVIGPSSMAGLAVLLILVPINGVIMGYFAKLQNQQMSLKDERLKSTSEVLRGIKILKLYAWEPSFERSVNDVRTQELSVLRKQSYVNAGVSMAWTSTQFLVSLAVYAVYVLASPNHVLDAQKAFVSINIINILNWTGALLPMEISFAVQAAISIKRITRMLCSDEVDPDAVITNHSQKPAIMINDGTFSWSKSQEAPTLTDVSLEVEEGTLVGVVGQVGSGKSSLISAVLGELHRERGTVSVKGGIAYVPQEAWIQNATLRDNILFGQTHNDRKYKDIVQACALEPDFKILSAGDQTEIGEKGINLSGGQKQRVSLARAVYQDRDIYLLDDPLSAVDANVGKHLFERVIGPQGLLKDKTRVLVTHGVTFLPQCHLVVVMRDGCVSEAGSYDDLLERDGAFAEFIKTYLQETEELSDDDLSSDEKQKREKLVRPMSQLSDAEHTRTRSESEGDSGTGASPRRKTSLKRRLSRKISRQGSALREDSVREKQPPPRSTEDADRLIEEEEAAEGAIKLRVVVEYLKALGAPASVGLMLSVLLYTGATIGTNIWLTAWSDDQVIAAGGPDAKAHTSMRLGGYAGLGIAAMIGVVSLSLCLFLGAVRGSMVLHTQLLKAVLRAPMSFFDTTPLGRILNRFSKDMDNIDVNVPMYMNLWLFHVAFVVATIVLISYSTPIFLVLFVPLTVIFMVVQRLYIASVRQLSRIDAIRRSPIYTNFDETLIGATCIRAFNQSERFIAKNEMLVDCSQISYYPIMICQRWLGFSLNTIGAFVVFFASLFAILERNTITGGLAGLSVSYAQQTAMIIDMLVQASSDLETHFVSVERVKEYSAVTPEASWEIEETKPAIGWPERGEVEFRDYSTRYRPGLDLVLKDLAFYVKPGEKVGIVGRTGAGKSSVTLALFRIIEAAGGSIHIDDVNINNIGLHDLRSKLTIIPQDPVLFSGSLRRNLDPFSSYTDANLWTALEHAHLKAFVTGLSEGLQYEVGEGGEALSVGQRQLVCLARALLRKTKILLLDEATAAVDLETDDLIQTMIRTEFKECTVLTIAHRLNTIMDYDRVMVLDAGRIKEYDVPSTLLSDAASLFHGLAKDAGLV